MIFFIYLFLEYKQNMIKRQKEIEERILSIKGKVKKT